MTAQQCTLIKCMLSSEKNVAVPCAMRHAGLSSSFEAAVLREWRFTRNISEIFLVSSLAFHFAHM